MIVCMFEAGRTNPGYGMATLIYNNLLNLILEVSRIIVPPVTQLLGQNDSIFSLGARKEKLSHFDLKIWVKIFFCQ